MPLSIVSKTPLWSSVRNISFMTRISNMVLSFLQSKQRFETECSDLSMWFLCVVTAGSLQYVCTSTHTCIKHLMKANKCVGYFTESAELIRSISSEFYACPRVFFKKKLRGLSPQANYTDQATAACRRS
jgi:hypothetical protein